MFRLISQEGKLLEDYLDFLDVVFSVESSLQALLAKNITLLERILRGEREPVGYRSSLVKFVLSTVLDFDYNVEQSTIWFLLQKYTSDPDVVRLLLEYIERGGKKVSSFDHSLMLRVVLTHTQEQEIQFKAKEMFNTLLPSSNIEKQFMVMLSEGNYKECQ